jgi:PEP-CTERM motif
MLSLALLILVAGLGAANAQMDGGTGVIIWPNADNEDFSLGYQVSVSSTISVYELGYNYFGVPLNSTHTVGIFDSSQNLLASAVVTNASTLYNDYLYTAISPTVLTPGNYWIAGTTLGLNDGWIYQQTTVTGFAGVSYIDSWFAPGNGGMLSFPSTSAPTRQYLEVNFMNRPLGTTPEPGTLALLGTGALCALSALRLRLTI